VLAWVASAIITFYILLIVPSGDVKEIIRGTARRSAPGMWFAPAMILLTVLSPVAFAASIALAINTTRLLILQSIRPAETKGIEVPRLFGSVELTFLRWNSVPALSGGFVILASVVALLWGWPMTAAILLVASAAIITALNVKAEGSSSRKPTAAPPSALSIALTILLAMMISAGGIEWKLANSSKDGVSTPTQVVTAVYVPPVDAPQTSLGHKAFPGVILRPDTPPDRTVPIPTRVPSVEAKSQASLVFSGE